MLKKIDFEKMDIKSKISWISNFLNEFDSDQIVELREFWEIRKEYLSEDVLMNIYDIILSQNKDFVNHSANMMSEYISNLKKQEETEIKNNNLEDILDSM